MIEDAQKAKAEKYLNSLVRYNKNIIPIREWLWALRDDGYFPVIETIRDDKKEDRERERLDRIFRSSEFVPGNPNWPATKKYLEDKAELEKGFFKTIYLMRNGRNSFVITKTAYDYLLEN